MDTEPKSFKEVTIYTPANVVFGNIVRIDVVRAEIRVGPHAQYKASAFLDFLRKGRRKAEALVVSDPPYVVVVPTSSAIEPDSLYMPDGKGRYSAADPRWRTDFDERLRSAHVPVLADYRDLPSKVEGSIARLMNPAVNVSQVMVAPDEALSESTVIEDAADLYEYEEGTRKEAERSFFERNARLARDAKEVHGCICQVCNFDFAKVYGALGQNVAEVHHLNPLSERDAERQHGTVRTTIDEVAVLCSNCHRMIHRRRPALTLDELRTLMSTNR